jgi:hypothetical protein
MRRRATLDASTETNTEVLIMYSQKEARPEKHDASECRQRVAECDYLSMLLTQQGKHRGGCRQCVALMGQYE